MTPKWGIQKFKVKNQKNYAWFNTGCCKIIIYAKTWVYVKNNLWKQLWSGIFLRSSETQHGEGICIYCYTKATVKEGKRHTSSLRLHCFWHYHSQQAFCPQMVSPKGPEPGTCLEVPTGSKYSVKVRAKPNGSIYSGHWSDWSDVLTGDTPIDRGKLPLRVKSG